MCCVRCAVVLIHVFHSVCSKGEEAKSRWMEEEGDTVWRRQSGPEIPDGWVRC